MLREKLEGLSDVFETGAMPQIHVSLGALAATAAERYETVSGD
jgi:hypothetical protein